MVGKKIRAFRAFRAFREFRRYSQIQLAECPALT